MLGDLVDPGGDLGVGRRHDLGAVAQVDLVAVVLRRVVRGGDHHAGDAAEVPDAEGDHRSRQRPRRDQGLEAGAGHDLGGVAGEDVGVVPGVEADDHPAAGQPVVQQVGRQPGRGLADDDPVHPVGPGTERTAQPGGAELQRPGEGVGELAERWRSSRVRGGQQIVELLPRLRIGILRRPGGDRAREVVGQRSTRSVTARPRCPASSRRSRGAASRPASSTSS